MANLSLKNVPQVIVESQVWKSIFRHGYAMNRRNRLLAITNNVFYHILPTKISRYGMRMRFHWGAGIITFYLFLILTFTGVLLMFYYVPTVPRAYYDMKDLQYVVPFGNILRNMHRYGAHAMVFHGDGPHGAHVLYKFLQAAPRIQLGRGCYSPQLHLPSEFQWVLAALGPIGDLGRDGRSQHGASDASYWA